MMQAEQGSGQWAQAVAGDTVTTDAENQNFVPWPLDLPETLADRAGDLRWGIALACIDKYVHKKSSHIF
jgi:hypothetical protein